MSDTKCLIGKYLIQTDKVPQCLFQMVRQCLIDSGLDHQTTDKHQLNWLALADLWLLSGWMVVIQKTPKAFWQKAFGTAEAPSDLDATDYQSDPIHVRVDKRNSELAIRH